MIEPFPNELSERELELLRLVATGASNKEIAQQLSISVNTVKVHLRNIFAKIGVASRTEAAMYAVRLGLVQPQGVPAVFSEEGKPESQEEVEPPGLPVTEPAAIQELSAAEAKAEVAARPRIRWEIGLVIILLLLGGVGLGRVFPRATATPTSLQSSATPPAALPWQVLKELPTAWRGLAVAAYENQLYAIGGETAQAVTGIVESYDPASDTWTEQTPKPMAVTDASAAVIGGLIYVPGGRMQTGQPTNIVEAYDPRQNRWQRLTALPAPISGYALVAFEGRLYLFGGWGGQSYLDTVYVYDPEQNVWEEHAPMSGPRAFSGAALVGRKIHILGGFDGVESYSDDLIYSPDLDRAGGQPWSEGSSLPEARYGMGTVSVVDTLYIVGGEGASKSLAALQRPPDEQAWQEFQGPIEQDRSHFGLVLLGTRLYAIGGAVNGIPVSENLAYQALYLIAIPVLK